MTAVYLVLIIVKTKKRNVSMKLDDFFDKPQDYFVKFKPDRPVYFSLQQD